MERLALKTKCSNSVKNFVADKSKLSCKDRHALVSQWYENLNCSCESNTEIYTTAFRLQP